MLCRSVPSFVWRTPSYIMIKPSRRWLASEYSFTVGVGCEQQTYSIPFYFFASFLMVMSALSFSVIVSPEKKKVPDPGTGIPRVAGTPFINIPVSCVVLFSQNFVLFLFSYYIGVYCFNILSFVLCISFLCTYTVSQPDR